MFKLEVSNFRVLRSANIEVKRGINILYGPNGAGKSSIIYALLSQTGIQDGKELDLESKLKPFPQTTIRVIQEDSRLRLEYDNGEYKCSYVEDDKVKSVSSESILGVGQCYRRFWHTLGVYRITWIAGDIVRMFDVFGSLSSILLKYYEDVINMNVNLWDRDGWFNLTQVPLMDFGGRLPRNLLNDIASLTDVSYMHRGHALKPLNGGEVWVPITSLSYGERKTILLLLAAYYSDMVVVEGFEGGLHFDLAVNLLDTLEDYNKYVIAETHMGILIPVGLKRGWNIYYVSDGEAVKVTKENIFEIELFRRELETYKTIRGF
jgi:hypothetical protein